MNQVRPHVKTVDESEAAGHVVSEREVEEVIRIFDPRRALRHRTYPWVAYQAVAGDGLVPLGGLGAALGDVVSSSPRGNRG
jgi:hypothetical protein